MAVASKKNMMNIMLINILIIALRIQLHPLSVGDLLTAFYVQRPLRAYCVEQIYLNMKRFFCQSLFFPVVPEV